MLVIILIVTVIVYQTVSLVSEMIHGVPAKRGNFDLVFSRHMENNRKRRNFRSWRSSWKYHFSIREYISVLVVTQVVVITFGMFFFRNMMSTMFLVLLGIWYPYYYLKSQVRKRKKQLNYQFKDALQSIANSLKAGNSLENAMMATHIDLKRVYDSEMNAPILYEFMKIREELEFGLPVNDVLIHFKQRTGIEDIEDFVNVAILTKDLGGNLNEVIQKVSATISDKIKVEQEINTLVAGKKYEASLLSVMPIFIVVILSVLSPTYMAPMYETGIGRVLMVVGVVLLLTNYLIGRRIIDIDI